MGRKEPAQFPRLLQHRPRIAGFIAVLNQGYPSRSEFLRRSHQAESVGKTTGVEDRIESGKDDHALSDIAVLSRELTNPIDFPGLAPVRREKLLHARGLGRNIELHVAQQNRPALVLPDRKTRRDSR